VNLVHARDLELVEDEGRAGTDGRVLNPVSDHVEGRDWLDYQVDLIVCAVGMGS
jgi:hypothetical protein